MTASSAAPRLALVTGFPGVVSLRLLELLGQEDLARWGMDRVVVLARAEHLELAETSVAHLSGADRFQVWLGDPAALDLGLAGPRYLDLCASLRFALSLSEPLNAAASPDDLAQRELSRVVELVELSRTAPALQRIVLSTSACCLPERGGVAYESELPAPERARDPASQARARAELSAARALPRSLVSFLRLGHLAEDPPPQLMMVLLLLLDPELRAGLPRAEAIVPLVPAQFVARACLAALMHRPTDPEATHAVHLVDPDSPTLERVMSALLRRLGHGEDPLRAAEVGRALARGPLFAGLRSGPRALYSALFVRTRYDTRRAAELMRPHDWSCPPFESYADPLASAVLAPLGTRRAPTLPPPPAG